MAPTKHKLKYSYFHGTKEKEIGIENITLTGLPDALHSSVTVLPFRAATCPFCGTALNVGGTKNNSFCIV